MSQFAQSFQRLKDIATLLQSHDIIDINELQSLQTEAQQLYEYCEQELKQTTSITTIDVASSKTV
jgi:Tfp pilus assembly protein PilN